MAKQKCHAPGFFRILLPGFSKRLPLPVVFLECIITERFNTKATLVNPNGGSWSVDVYEENQQIYFEGDGWIEFVHAHNLMLGYFLLFTYRGDMVFDFRAYDLSTCEITYRSMAQNGIHEKVETSKRKRVTIQETRKYPNSEPRSMEEKKIIKRKIITIKEILAKKEHFSLDPRGMGEKKTRKRKMSKILPRKEYCCLDSPMTSTSKRTRFEAVINPYNFTKPYLGVPAAVLKECNELKQIDRLTLKDPEGRQWQVKLFHRKGIRNGYGYSVHLSAGWTKFVRGNELKLGDKCVFELLLQGEEKVVNVHIIRLVKSSIQLAAS